MKTIRAMTRLERFNLLWQLTLIANGIWDFIQQRPGLILFLLCCSCVSTMVQVWIASRWRNSSEGWRDLAESSVNRELRRVSGRWN